MVQARIGADGTVGMMVRMPEKLRNRIKAAADANGRSQNSEIVEALSEKYPENDAILRLKMHLEALTAAVAQSPIDYEMTPEIAAAVRRIREDIRRLTSEIIEAQAAQTLAKMNLRTDD
ncbi:Arc family DNA-binding protein [Pararhodobacter aggregans]|uniref:Arc family DNA-binding protein n=1 Tax=Pararhodobacter aggregans TaxID=404875 RepID=UPI003A937C57